MSDDERAIRALAAAWMAATRRGDKAALLDLVTQDVVFLTPGLEPFGRDAFLQAGLPEGATFDGHTDIREVEIHGDMAWMRSHIEVTITPPSGAPVHHAGHALAMLRKGTDGRWRIARDANLVARR